MVVQDAVVVYMIFDYTLWKLSKNTYDFSAALHVWISLIGDLPGKYKGLILVFLQKLDYATIPTAIKLKWGIPRIKWKNLYVLFDFQFFLYNTL